MDSANRSDDHACFDDKGSHRLFFVLDTQKHYLFFRFLQHGFFVRARTGKSIKGMLCDQFGLESDYVVNRIKTIFYNGKPVDDMETAIVHDGATLALSAAMPGLVGATFRSGGVLSSSSNFDHINGHALPGTTNRERKGQYIVLSYKRYVLFYYTALCAEGARHISPGQRPGFDTPYDFSPVRA